MHGENPVLRVKSPVEAELNLGSLVRLVALTEELEPV